jgi:hypothetical protein
MSFIYFKLLKNTNVLIKMFVAFGSIVYVDTTRPLMLFMRLY